MLQWDEIVDALSDPAVIRYIIGGIIALVVIIICIVIHNKLSK